MSLKKLEFTSNPGESPLADLLRSEFCQHLVVGEETHIGLSLVAINGANQSVELPSAVATLTWSTS
jgi:hypothetical protein